VRRPISDSFARMIGRRLGVAAVLVSVTLFTNVAAAEERCAIQVSRATYLSRAGLLVEAREAMLAAGGECADAREQAVELSWRIPKAFLHVAGRPASEITVLLDGTALDRSALGVPQRMNPGEHVFVARTTDGAERHATFILAEGESKSITIDFLAGTLAEARPDAAAVDKRDTSLSPLVWGGFGLAAVGLAVGATTGIMAMQKTERLEEQCVGGAGICAPSAIHDIEAAKTYATISTVSLVAAAGGAAIGIVGLMTGGSPKETPKREAGTRVNVGLGSVGVAGSF
jgi:hypothetical protein